MWFALMEQMWSGCSHSCKHQIKTSNIQSVFLLFPFFSLLHRIPWLLLFTVTSWSNTRFASTGLLNYPNWGNLFLLKKWNKCHIIVTHHSNHESSWNERKPITGWCFFSWPDVQLQTLWRLHDSDKYSCVYSYLEFFKSSYCYCSWWTFDAFKKACLWVRMSWVT